MKKLVSVGAMMLVILMGVVMVGCGKEYGESDFSLEISVNSETLNQGDDIEVEIIFKNLSGKKLNINHSSAMILPYIADKVVIMQEGEEVGIYLEIRPLDVVSSVMKKDEVKRITRSIGSLLPIGEFDLVASAVFQVSGFDNYIHVTSNTIVLTVLENE